MNYLRHTDIDKSRWDKAIEKSFNGMVYARSWYLDIVSPGWEALAEEDYSILFPLTYRKKYGINYLFPPFFTQQLGLFSEHPLDSEKTNEFLSVIPEKFRHIEINLNAGNTNVDSTYKTQRLSNYKLWLDKPYEELKANYSENLRRNLKKARAAVDEKNNLTLTNSFETSELIQLFKLNRGNSDVNLREKDYIVFRKLMDKAEEKSLLIKSCIRENNMLQAGAIFLKSDREWIFIFSATGREAREYSAMSYIVDDFIQQHAGQALYLDFEGSMNESLARFYKNFGSSDVVYLQLVKNKLPALLRWMKSSYKL